MVDILDEMRQALIDAQYMFLQIERNRQLPSQTEIIAQYTKLGQDIRNLLDRMILSKKKG